MRKGPFAVQAGGIEAVFAVQRTTVESRQCSHPFSVPSQAVPCHPDERRCYFRLLFHVVFYILFLDFNLI
jgi:hypothetical protein